MSIEKSLNLCWHGLQGSESCESNSIGQSIQRYYAMHSAKWT